MSASAVESQVQGLPEHRRRKNPFDSSIQKLLQLEEESSTNSKSAQAFARAWAVYERSLSELMQMAPFNRMIEPDDLSRRALQVQNDASLGEEERRAELGKIQELIASEREKQRQKLLAILLYDTRIREYGEGEIVVRAGDYGNSAFLILRGAVRVVIDPALSGAQVGKSEGRQIGVLNSLFRWLGRSKDPEARKLAKSVTGAGGYTSEDQSYVPIFLQDVPRILKRHRTVSLGRGELFGEIAALGRMPRVASLFAEDESPAARPEAWQHLLAMQRAHSKGSGALAWGSTEGDAQAQETKTLLLEIRWQGLRDLLKADKEFKEHVYRLYRRNALREHLGATPMLRYVGDTPGIRSCLASGATGDLFERHLGWRKLEGKTLRVSTSQSAEERYQVRVASGPLSGTVIPLDKGKPFVIGRDKGTDLQPNPQDLTLSRRHATLQTDAHGFWILTNNSRFGSLVESEIVRRNHPLNPGQVIQVGGTQIVFEMAGEASGVLGQDAYELTIAAETTNRGAQNMKVYQCPPGPDGEVPSAIHRERVGERVSRHGRRYIVVFTNQDTSKQVWRWALPNDRDPGSFNAQEYAFDSQGDPRTLIGRLLRELVLEEISNATEFQSYGEFTWSRKSLSEREAGIDWAKRSESEPVIAAEGHHPNGVMLIRAGFARLSVKYGSGVKTLNYLGRGAMYGFEETAHNWTGRWEGKETRPKQVPLQYTLRALGYVDTILIPTPVIERFVLPSIPPEELPEAIEVGGEDGSYDLALVEQRVQSQAPERISEALMEFLVERRFVNGTKAMVIDMNRCVRCDDCVRGCASTHQGNPRFLRHGPRFGKYMVANACMHCADPVCMIECPTGAIHRAAGGGQVVVNDTICIGCGTCSNNCPYNNIRMVDIRDAKTGAFVVDGRPQQRATKCDLCFDQPGGPACQRACPHDALVRIDLNDLSGLAEWSA